MRGRAAQLGGQAPVARDRVAAGDDAGVDVLEVVGDARPRQPARERARRRPRSRSRSARVGDEPLELGGQRLDVARLEQQAVGALAERLLVDGQARRERDGAGVDRAQQQAGRGRRAVGGGDEDVAAGQQLGLAELAGRRVAHARLEVGAQRRAARRAARGDDRRLPRRRRVQAAQRAQEQPQRGALLVVDEAEAHAAARGAARAARRVGAGQQHAVVGREEALHEAARWRRSSRCARRGGRARAGRPCARPASTAGARSARGTCRRSARASGAARRSTSTARTARARGRRPAAGSRGGSRSCARRRPGAPARGGRCRAGRAARRRPRARAAARRARAAATAGSSRAALSAWRVSRTASLEREGATISTWWPRAASSAVVRST